jgi:hypothetical protein
MGGRPPPLQGSVGTPTGGGEGFRHFGKRSSRRRERGAALDGASGVDGGPSHPALRAEPDFVPAERVDRAALLAHEAEDAMIALHP